jgi:hypothetical protein
MAARETRGHLPNSFMLSASSMQWFKKGHSSVLLVGTYCMVLMSQTFIFPSSSYRFLTVLLFLLLLLLLLLLLVVVVVVVVVVAAAAAAAAAAVIGGGGGGGGVKVVICVYHNTVTGYSCLVWLCIVIG